MISGYEEDIHLTAYLKHLREVYHPDSLLRYRRNLRRVDLSLMFCSIKSFTEQWFWWEHFSFHSDCGENAQIPFLQLESNSWICWCSLFGNGSVVRHRWEEQTATAGWAWNDSIRWEGRPIWLLVWIETKQRMDDLESYSVLKQHLESRELLTACQVQEYC